MLAFCCNDEELVGAADVAGCEELRPNSNGWLFACCEPMAGVVLGLWLRPENVPEEVVASEELKRDPLAGVPNAGADTV